jgi:hypothetical protein
LFVASLLCLYKRRVYNTNGYRYINFELCNKNGKEKRLQISASKSKKPLHKDMIRIHPREEMLCI